MELRQLDLVVAVAEEGTFTGAATRLRVAQPAVSQQIRSLERHLGYPLFRRGAQGAVPTPECLALLPAARVALAAMDDVHAVARRTSDAGVATRVRLGTALSVDRMTLTGLVVEHARRHPDVALEVTRAGSGRLLELVREQRLDLAVVATRSDRIPPGVRAHWLPRSPVLCIVPPGHPLAGRPKVSLADVLAHPLVALAHGTGLRTSLDHAAAALDLAPRIRAEIDDVDIVLDLVAQGLGVTLLPAAAAAARPELPAVELTSSPLVHHAAVVWPARPRVREAAEQVRGQLLERLTRTARPDDPTG